MNQKSRILAELKKGNWFSLGEALYLSPPVYRLSERIRELRAAGYEIESARVKGKTYQMYRLQSPRLGESTESLAIKAFIAGLPAARKPTAPKADKLF